ncbi:hypothetical protein MY4824_000537 [Beauveria thailandica]
MAPPTSHAPALGATVHQMLIKPMFDTLEPREKMYAHHMARAGWHGSRIIMRQVSAESPGIFDFIMDLYHACDGQWNRLVTECNITDRELQAFLEYAATFLCNLGNYYASLVSRHRLRNADLSRAKATESFFPT